MTPAEKALKLCQNIAWSTCMTDCNEGMTLPLEISKKIAIICVDNFIDDLNESLLLSKELHPRCQGLIMGSLVVWNEVKSEIEKL